MGGLKLNDKINCTTVITTELTSSQVWEFYNALTRHQGNPSPPLSDPPKDLPKEALLTEPEAESDASS